MGHNKLCLIIGNQNAIIYKGIFKLIMDNKLLIGHNKIKEFYRPDGSTQQFGNVCWFTNMKVNKCIEKLALTKTYNPTDYPKYDNYDAIEVGRVANIPKDYYGVMSVPITFIFKYNPNQFKILGCSGYSDPDCYGCVNKKEKYVRILIRRKK